MGFFQKELLYTLIIMGGSMSFGLTMAYYSPAYKGLVPDLELNNQSANIFNSLAPILSIFGGIIIGKPTSEIGRKKTLFIIGICAVTGWISLPLTQKSFKWLAFISRGLLGLTVGSFSSICPLYITELAPIDHRGSYGVLNQFGVVIGACLSYGLGIFLNWRTLSFISSIPPLLMCLFIFILPESPRFGQVELNIKDDESLFNNKYKKPLIISLALMFFQQFSGVNGLLSNLEKIFNDSGSSIKPSVASFLVGLSGVISTGIASPLVGYLGRITSWNISSILCSIALLIAGLNEWFKWSKLIPLICLFSNNLVFGLGLGPIPWFVVPELFPDSVRSFAMSLMTAINWTFASLVMFFFPTMQNTIGLSTSLLFYSIVCFISLIFGLFSFPDTGNKEMGDEI